MIRMVSYVLEKTALLLETPLLLNPSPIFSEKYFIFLSLFQIVRANILNYPLNILEFKERDQIPMSVHLPQFAILGKIIISLYFCDWEQPFWLWQSYVYPDQVKQAGGVSECQGALTTSQQMPRKQSGATCFRTLGRPCYGATRAALAMELLRCRRHCRLAQLCRSRTRWAPRAPSRPDRRPWKRATSGPSRTVRSAPTTQHQPVYRAATQELAPGQSLFCHRDTGTSRHRPVLAPTLSILNLDTLGKPREASPSTPWGTSHLQNGQTR